MAAKGYPGAYAKGTEIRGLEAAEALDGVQVFHAGTRHDGDRILANGGRVLNVTAPGGTSPRRRRAPTRPSTQDRLAGRLLPPRHRLAGRRARTRLTKHAAAATLRSSNVPEAGP